MEELFGRFNDTEAVPQQVLMDAVNGGLAPQHAFGEVEAQQMLETMTENEEVMLSDGFVYKL